VADLKSAIKAVHDFDVEIVIVTLGMKGAVLSIGGAMYEIPAYTPNKLVDPTGAGDAFIGGFFGRICSWQRSPMVCMCWFSASLNGC
jgi:sugar/nucleoside kinase (ribokinase family)